MKTRNEAGTNWEKKKHTDTAFPSSQKFHSPFSQLLFDFSLSHVQQDLMGFYKQNY